MESSTRYPDYVKSADTPTGSDPEWYDPLNRTTYVVYWLTFLVLGCLLEIAVIVLVVRLYMTRPKTWRVSPRLCIMLVYCVLGMLHALGPVPVLINNNISVIQKSTDNFILLKCHGKIAVYLSINTFKTAAKLLIAAVILVEAVRLQRYVTVSVRRQMGLALVLVTLTMSYCFFIIIPVFYNFILKDPYNPCTNDGFDVNSVHDIDRIRIFYIFQYILPCCFVLMSCVLLVVGHRTRRGRVVHCCSSLTEITSSQPCSKMVTALGANGLSQRSQSSCDTMSAGQYHLRPPNPPAHEALPVNLLLAAAVSIIFSLVSFVAFFFYVSLASQLGEEVYQRLRVTGFLINALSGVFIPCCWLFDAQLRQQRCWCRHAAQTRSLDLVPLVGEMLKKGEVTRI